MATIRTSTMLATVLDELNVVSGAVETAGLTRAEAARIQQYNADGSWIRPMLPFQCIRRDCGDVRWARRAPICHGVNAWHRDLSVVMEVIDPDDAPPDTPGLVVT